jgi:histidinol-phosphate aminotransferase
LLQASPTFGAIEHYALAMGADVTSVGLTPAFAHDLAGMLARANSSTALVYICNPNNPTASLTPRDDLDEFIRKLPLSSIVVIDEAYCQFAGRSATYSSFLDRPLNDPRIVVTRTFSKVYGLAGLRLGYAVASSTVAARLRAFLTEDNINTIGAEAALAALDDMDALNDFVQRNASARQEFFNQAMARALKPIDSHANFVMMDTLHPANDVTQQFRAGKIVIGPSFPEMKTHIRVSLGSPEDMLAFWRVWDALPYPKHTMHH